ncbi:Bifunctional coenzyme A synthase [Seminavis robusta]|uniref:Bifunctional coenzyme A synthase n=1 Tax=Seminavis robusta TaxID=568900 RepID=A0A9N8HIU9_9STRA|nr:Bifunctional coenzyme A synthase [Seminavis robusta]|eukprot:Sro647_g180900.1 Bifunctional coenzyme A synthase (492) ;mRNA; r:25337-26812
MMLGSTSNSRRITAFPLGLWSGLFLLLLLKYQVHGAFTQSFGASLSQQHAVRTKQNSEAASSTGSTTNSAPILLFGGRNNNNIQSTSSLSVTANGANGSASSVSNNSQKKQYQHVLAILTMPNTSMDRIANEAILNQALSNTNKLSIFLRCQGGKSPSLANLRRYMGEVYSQLWDFAMASDAAVDFNNVVVYPQNLPNSAAEQWIYHLPDLDAVCSHDSICGWISEGAGGRGAQFQFQLGDGVGGLDTHVQVVNEDRLARGLQQVTALHVKNWPIGASAIQLNQEHVIFVDDDAVARQQQKSSSDDNNSPGSGLFLGGARIPDKSLFNCVAVGGTFDGMHYGHRKLLTLAVSSILPVTGRLMVGVTVDDMLQSKQFAEYIPSMKERMEGVREFLHRLAPGMKNRISIEPISDAYGPPGKAATGAAYDALVLSHETLENGVKLNQHRATELGMEPLTLLCTRRTEAYGMSSTTLRRLRSMSKVETENVLDRV